MTSLDVLSRHLQLCDELQQLALEENRFLKEQQRAPDPALVERRQAMLARLEESLAQLKTAEVALVPQDEAERQQRRERVEKARSRILQILHLQRENEQLVLRYSLGAPRLPSTPPPLPTARLQKIYERHA